MSNPLTICAQVMNAETQSIQEFRFETIDKFMEFYILSKEFKKSFVNVQFYDKIVHDTFSKECAYMIDRMIPGIKWRIKDAKN